MLGSAVDQAAELPASADSWLAYDGECPFCSRYVHLLRLQECVGPVRLIDARRGGPEVDLVLRRGLNLDQGMVFYHADQFYHGADCVQKIAFLTTPSRLFNRLNAIVLRSPKASRALYPLLRAGRNLALRLLGRKPLREAGLETAPGAQQSLGTAPQPKSVRQKALTPRSQGE
jgi:predicted DCC family thiol-disulfide oxidoreductase YuxK